MTTSSTNYTGLYGGTTGGAIPNTAYGNANVVSLLAVGTDGANTVGNITAAGNISVGNILTDGYYYANGAPFGGGSTYGDSNVTTLLASFGSNSISTTGNVTAGYFAGDGSQLSNINAGNIVGTYGNANVANFLANYGSNTLSTTGNVTSGNLLTSGILSATSNVRGGNINTAGIVSATSGIVTADGVTAGGNISTTGNVIAPNVYTSNIIGAAGQNVTITADGTNDIHLDADTIRIGDNNTDATIVTHGTGDLILRTHEGDANQGNIRIYDGANGNIDINPNGSGTVNVTGTGGIKVSDGISATGNITGSYFLGNGSQLTGLPATYGNANVATFLANFGSNTISTTGNITGGNIAGTLTTAAQPNITSVGTLTSLSSTGNIQGANLITGGLITASGNIRGGNIITGGQVSALGNISGGNLAMTGAASITGNITSLGNLSAGNAYLTSLQTNGLLAQTLTTTAWANIGTDLQVAGSINAPGSTISAATLSLTGNVNAVNFNGSGRVSTSGNVVGGNITTPGLISATGNITGGNIIGNLIGSISQANVANYVAVTGTGTSTAYYLLMADNTGGSNSLAYTDNSGQINYNPSTDTLAVPFISTTGNIVTGGNLVATGYVTATGNVSGGNISTVGNVTGAYIKGNGSFLTNLASPTALTQDLNTAGYKIYNATTGGNVEIGDSSSTGNINLRVSSGVFASVQNNGAFQLNGMALYTNQDVSATGNVTGGNINTAGIVSATGNVRGGNLTTAGQVSSTGNITSAGNISGGNLLATTALTAPFIYSNSVSVNGPIAGTTLNATGNITAPGSDIFAGNIRLTGAGQGIVTATGNIQSSSYFVGDGTYLTNVPAVISGNLAGNLNGANTYSINNLQDLTINPTGGNISIGSVRVQNFNNRWYFATDTDIAGRLYATGNLQTDSNVVTSGYVTATGNVTGGNIVINGSNMQSKNAWDANTSPQQARITVGTGYNGDYSTTYDPQSASRGSQLAVINKQNIGNADSNQSVRLFSSTLYADLGGATLTNNNRRLAGFFGAVYMGNGIQNMTTNPYFGASGGGTAMVVGNSGSITMGNATVGHVSGVLNSVAAGGGGNIGNAIGGINNVSTFSATGNITNAMGTATYFAAVTTPSTPPTTVIGYYMPGTTNTYGITNNNSYRAASNYYFLKNDDNVAQNQLGSLRAYTEYDYINGTSGSLTIDKNNGQVQQIDLTGNVTGLTFSNFVTSASDSVNTDYQVDTVTLIFNQGSTGGYGVTFPAQSSTVKYAGNVTALQSTAANSVSLVSVSAAYIGGATTYLITISPGFV